MEGVRAGEVLDRMSPVLWEKWRAGVEGGEVIDARVDYVALEEGHVAE